MTTAAGKDSQNVHVATGATPVPPDEVRTLVPDDMPAATANPPLACEAAATPTDGSLPVTQPPDTPTLSPGWRGQGEGKPPAHRSRKWLLLAGTVAALVVGGNFLVPWVDTALNTVSTDDAYVNGHVTFVTPRVKGQVVRVLVDDNTRVKKGDLLVQLDKEPYRVEVNRKQAALGIAEAKLVQARAQVRATVATAKALRYKLQDAMQEVRSRVQQLQADVATLRQYEANLGIAQKEYNRVAHLAQRSGAASGEELDTRRAAFLAAEALVRTGRENIRKTRAALNVPLEPPAGKDLGDVPADLEQNHSSVRAALSQLVEAGAQLGVELPRDVETPAQLLARFHIEPADSRLEDFVRKLIEEAPAIKVASADVEQARHDLAQAQLDLRYCDIASEIDGVVTSRNVNPGNDVQAGQSLMAVRSLTEIWIDANFKETQLADLRIGQRVRCEVDMYGSKKEFEGRITGFTMGTGQTLALLPPQNATGNFVKIVQRLPVRIELTDYDPAKAPLFVGLSVTPYVYYKEPPVGPHAGEVLQPPAALPTGPTSPQP
jgi:membrane fusion protein (multidrug efflux system)